jgi:hypothetical protein
VNLIFQCGGIYKIVLMLQLRDYEQMIFIYSYVRLTGRFTQRSGVRLAVKRYMRGNLTLTKFSGNVSLTKPWG